MSEVKQPPAVLFELAEAKHAIKVDSGYEHRTGDWAYKFVTMKRVKQRPTKAEKSLEARIAGYQPFANKGGFHKPGSQSGRK